ncbi:very short patch repair endonuclease [Hansschlegelia plantiphila]|uniref:Very short patch repair endonuclease n=2 Tax=Hansschlegelia plantiphila TaxID=374655 RepID=A0A9W6MVG3_9HYPH|nr:very short patch repair endonuclease [Hansschlegelia plantiphila]GLK68409.1 very short patch repair endonuclease [Hansschlegelia plantiphila]
MRAETPAERSAVMRAVKSRDTGPEMIVRRAAHALGYRFRLHAKSLPGSPDLVFPSRRKAVFVHGCFWHGHDCARGARAPKANAEYWSAKIARNTARDERVRGELAALGWDTLTVWECELKAGAPTLPSRLAGFLGRPGRAR